MPNDAQKPEPDPQTQQRGGEGFDAAPCSAYIPFTEIPSSVLKAAETMYIYFEKQGMREWEFSYVADRRLVSKLERERDDLKSALLAMREYYKGYMISGNVYNQVERALNEPNVEVGHPTKED